VILFLTSAINYQVLCHLKGLERTGKQEKKIEAYHGNLGLDTKGPLFFPEARYDSKIMYNTNSSTFNLHGTVTSL
jgi:hypothetical protein